MILKKISCKRLSEEKNCMQHKYNRKLMAKKGKKYPAHQIARKKESFRFEDEGDYESEFFPILSSAHARANVILAGKFGSRRQSTSSFSGKVLVAKTSYQMIEILLFSGRERALSLSMEISVSTFVVKKCTMKLCRVSILGE